MTTDTSSISLQPLLSMRQLRQLIPLSASQIYRLVKAGAFPAQVQVSPNRVAWRQADIAAWLNQTTRPAAAPFSAKPR